jgi:hypothetical protein
MNLDQIRFVVDKWRGLTKVERERPLMRVYYGQGESCVGNVLDDENGVLTMLSTTGDTRQTYLLGIDVEQVVGLKIELEFAEPPQLANVASIEAKRRSRLGTRSEPPR